MTIDQIDGDHAVEGSHGDVPHGQRPGRRVEHLSVADRAAKGKAAREAVPRSSLAEWMPSPGRRDPVAVLEDQAMTRVPDLVPVRYGRMLVSPFTFYRGAAAVMAADLAAAPRTGMHVQLCGDAHLSNFGGFAAPDRKMIFSINDFDETLPGPFEWDLKRLAASFAVAGRERGFDTKQRERLNVDRRAGLPRWRCKTSRGCAPSTSGMPGSTPMRSGPGGARPGPPRSSASSAAWPRLGPRTASRAFAKLTHLVGGEHRFISDPPLIVPIEELLARDDHKTFENGLRTALRAYRHTLPGDRRHLLERYRYVHVARKVVGVGSVGTRAWILLMTGNDATDPIVLQFKEAEASVLEPYLGASGFASHGQRVVAGQRLMQAASDIMLGWFARAGLDGEPTTTTSGSCGTASSRPSSRPWTRGVCRSTRRCADGRWPGPTPAPVTRSPSRATSGQSRSSTGPRGVRRVLRRPERAGLRGPALRRRHRPDHGADRSLIVAAAPVAARRSVAPGAARCWSSSRNGFMRRSRPTVVTSPWPGSTCMSSAIGRIFAAIDAISVLERSARQVGAADRAGEEVVAGEQDGRLALDLQLEAHRTEGVARRVDGGERHAGAADLLAVVEARRSLRRPQVEPLEVLAEHAAGAHRVDQHVAVGVMDVHLDVLAVVEAVDHRRRPRRCGRRDRGCSGGRRAATRGGRVAR